VFWGLVYSFELLYFLSWLIYKRFPKTKPAILIHVLAFVGIISLGYAYFIEPYWIDVHHVHIKSPKFKNTSLILVQISDLHCDEKIRNERKVVEIINDIQPDVVVFTGDALNTDEALVTFQETLSAVKASLGKFAVRGNFDVCFWRNFDFFGNTGFAELNGTSVTLTKNGSKITISGLSAVSHISDFLFLHQIPVDHYSIFLYHYPGINEECGDAPVDLFLSGHTHGGQIALPFYGALVTLSKYGKKYESGYYDSGGKILYVNRGIGMEGGLAPRVRFWARPEITVFHIEPVKKNEEDNKYSQQSKNLI
ncbi:MAG: metallophosphoesterase, partial [Candidatus Aureabacteria bacterium]|nr:metallophosphoesterase [Candidatus Auribacterota bacterium]